MEKSQATLRGLIEGTRFAQIPIFLKNLAWQIDVDIHLEVDKGFIRESVRYEVSGDADKVTAFQNAVKKAVDSVDSL